jgi:hypothetical protein
MGVPMAAMLILAAALVISACSSPARPTPLAPAPETIDVLDFIIGDAEMWPRHGDRGQHQIVDMGAREICR